MTSTDPNRTIFVKGHGTENDFVLLPDRDDTITLTPELVRRLCDRRAGVGADGVIRVAPGEQGAFLMDYWNADGTVAEMCGNGSRVFARFLVDAGWVPTGRVDFDTRGGLRTAELDATGDVRVHMGPVTLGQQTTSSIGDAQFAGRAADVGNPHLVCWADDPAGLDLREYPGFDAAVFPQGVNVEFIKQVGEAAIDLRVYERGVGETRSCGTGTVAASAVFLASNGLAEGTVAVHVPGGDVVVEIVAGQGFLTGPAVLVYSGTLNPMLVTG